MLIGGLSEADRTKAIALGAKVSGSVSKKTDLVVAARDATLEGGREQPTLHRIDRERRDVAQHILRRLATLAGAHEAVYSPIGAKFRGRFPWLIVNLLTSDDRWVRFAARLVLERMPVEAWREKIVLPAAAVAQDGAEYYVFQENGRKFDRRAVHVEHRDERSVVIANDGARIAEPNNGTGLNGLRERVGAVGGIVETVQDEDRFTLTAHFPSRTKESR